LLIIELYLTLLLLLTVQILNNFKCLISRTVTGNLKLVMLEIQRYVCAC